MLRKPIKTRAIWTETSAHPSREYYVNVMPLVRVSDADFLCTVKHGVAVVYTNRTVPNGGDKAQLAGHLLLRVSNFSPPDCPSLQVILLSRRRISITRI
jgi:hypothetical protein